MKCRDFVGTEYESVTEMCERYRISNATYYGRLRSGWSQKDALTVDVKHKNSRYNRYNGCVSDGMGNEFESVACMCDYYSIEIYTYYRRIRNGYTIYVFRATGSADVY